MQYTKKTKWNEIKKKYNYVVAWGTGSLFQMNYRKEYYPLDLLVDGTEKQVGMKFDDLTICGPDKISTDKNDKVLIVIYTIYEYDILNKISELGINADTIIYNLLIIEEAGDRKVPFWNGKHADDMILLELVNRLGFNKKKYLDIGVCHPIMRNNTYLLNEFGWTGVLVEPNPIFRELINIYRKNDLLLECGAGSSNGMLQYYSFPDHLGYGTFEKKIGEIREKSGLACVKLQIPIIGINTIIEEYFETYPAIIDIDIEGMDYEILKVLDTKKYPVEIIMCETQGDEEKYCNMMSEKGYLKYASVGENTIFLRQDIIPNGLFAIK
ncbi:FkbM family methyltransferase [Lachnospiraceae bacterium MD1]|uniref:FkbM family methyltransferase n=1 Tax=Variimorphobacter saccharofermentans TaxID=2755051 RepID=A0A839JWT6_9FIRM|nr:FkbM family methyltransferase [Variimorphobacter saccharofermentans]MBB2181697.1 FkbM family methyltransferase [Variimorphobacter saccharofermentans]